LDLPVAAVGPVKSRRGTATQRKRPSMAGESRDGTSCSVQAAAEEG
jgi:hypothetical protein